MRLPRAAVTLLALGCAATAAACTPSNAEDTGAVQSIRLANPYESRTPFNSCGMSRLPEAVERAGSELDVEIYPDGSLGSEGETVEQVVTGELDGTVAGPAFLGKWYEPSAVMESYYVFDSLREMEQAADGPEGQRLWDRFRSETGVRVLDSWYLGARYLMSTEPIRTPEDLQGKRMRVPDNQLHMLGAAAMGATPMPVPLGETYIGLQQGLISAVEGPLNTSDAAGFQEVTNYITLTGHVRTPVPVMINEQIWNRIPDKDQRILVEQLRRLGDRATRCTERQDAKILRNWVRDGDITVVQDADLEAFRSAVRDQVTDDLGWADIYQRLTAD